MIKKIFRYSLYTLGGLVLALFLLPFVFKDKIVEGLKKVINEEILAVVEFKNADVSFLRSFPDVNLVLEDLSVTGIDTFEDLTLCKLKKVELDVDIMSLISSSATPSVNYFGMEEGQINVMVLSDGTTNYDITKPDTTAAQKPEGEFLLNIKKYELNNVDISYIDQSMALYSEIKNFFHTGKGDFKAAKFDLETSSRSDSLSVRYDGTNYLKNANVSVDAVIAVDTENETYALKENTIRCNELELSGNMSVGLKDSLMDIDLNVATPFEDIRNILSVVPNAYTKDFKDVKTRGEASFALKMKGIYDSAKSAYPGFDFSVKVKDGYILYPGSPFPVDKIQLDLTTSAQKPDYSDIAILVPAFRFDINKQLVSGNLAVNNAMADQEVSGKIQGKLNLADVKKSLPVLDLEDMKGQIDANVSFKTLMSYVINESYEKINASGNINAKNFYVKYKESPPVSFSSGIASFSPAKVNADFSDFKMGSSNVNFKAVVDNPLAYLSTQKGTRTEIVFIVDQFIMDEWSSGTDETDTNTNAEIVLDKNQENFVKKSSILLDGKIGKVKSGDLEVSNLVLKGDAGANNLEIAQLSGNVGKSDFVVSGFVRQIFDYLFSNGTLIGDINLTSKNFDANAFMSETPENESTEASGPFVVPARMDLVLNGRFNELQYTNLNLKNAEGEIRIKNEEAFIRGFTTNIFGGKIAMDGQYEAKNINSPGYAVKLDLSKIKFVEAFSVFELFKKVMPVAKYIDGMFNTTLVMRGNLTKDMSVDLSSLDASGFIETLQGKINAYPPLLSLGNKLQIKEIHNFDITDTKNWFEIVKGIVEFKPFQKTVQGIDMDVSGKHNFGKGMDVLMKMKIPRKMLEKSKITAAANTGLKFLESEAGKAGLNINQGDFIYLNVNLTGSLLKPDIKITPVNAQGASGGSAVNQMVDETKKQLKDTLQKEINKQKERAKDSLTKVVNKEVDKVKTKVEAQTQKALDSIKNKAKDKVINKLDTLTKGTVSDSLKQKARDVLDKNTNQEIDKIKDKLKDFDPFKKRKKD